MSGFVVFRCEKCGNMLLLLKNGGGPLTCCGQSMLKEEANTTDASVEKHVPEVVKEDGKIVVTVGSTLHPSLPEHYIEWIALVSDDSVQIKYLKPGMDPIAEFPEVDTGTVYEYCNIHGLWKKDF